LKNVYQELENLTRIPGDFAPRNGLAGHLEDRLMDVSKILAELRAEREQIEEAILSLERLARGRGRRRGRPPAWMSGGGETEAPKRRGRPPGSKNKQATAMMPAAKGTAVA
jgi:hypothetical protein